MRKRSAERVLTAAKLNEHDLLGNLFKTAFSLVNCVIETTKKVKIAMNQGTESAVQTVEGLQNDLKSMLVAFNEIGPEEETGPSNPASEIPSSAATSLSSSSSSCALRTASNCNIGCTATIISTRGGLNKRAEGTACKTACGAPITKCDATGITSTSTSTSTSVVRQRCSRNCASCNDNFEQIQVATSYPSGYRKASNGVFYSPAPTVTHIDGIEPSPVVGELVPENRMMLRNQESKRTLSQPQSKCIITSPSTFA